MGSFAIGQIITLSFPFSDLSNAKIRPALIIADSGRNDWIVCQITSQEFGDPRAIVLNEEDFESGSLKLRSFARPGKLFTAHESLLREVVGTLTATKQHQISVAVQSLFAN